MTPDRFATDVLVIGSGPGGAVTATLWAEAGLSVLMLEEGERLPLGSSPHFSGDEILEKYRRAGITVAFGPAKVTYVEGCVVGGGSEVNRGLYHRTPAGILERWARDYRVVDIDFDSMRPHHEACEATARIEPLPGPAPLLSRRLGDGAAALGWRAVEARRLFRYDGVAGGGSKQSMSATFVPRFERAGGRVMADTRALGFSRSGGRWLVKARHAPPGAAPRLVEIAAERLVVACGAVQTPALLRRSGIRHNVGDTLRLHPMLKVVAVFPDAVNRPGDLDPVHQITEFEPGIGIGCSVSKRPILSLAMVPHARRMREVDENWQRMGIYYVQTGGGVGSVRNLPGFRDPLVRIRRSAADVAELYTGLRRLIEALFAAGAETVYPSIPGFPVLRGPGDLALLPETLAHVDAAATSVHVFCSCPMGEDRDRTAADSFGRVHGADDLYIADASLLCTPTGVNPQGTVMAIAHRNAVANIERAARRRAG